MFALIALVLASSPSMVELGIGEETVLTFPQLTRVSVGDPNVADVHVDKESVLITGKSEGSTTLIIWSGEQHESRTLHVTKDAAAQLRTALEKLLPDASLTVDELAGKHVIQGTLPDDAALARLKALVADSPNVVLLVKVEPVARLTLVEAINAALAKAHIQHAHASVVGDRIFLEGEVDDEAERTRAQAIADSVIAARAGP